VSAAADATVDAAAIAGVAAQLGLAISPAQADALAAYAALLARWNRTYNLTALRDPAQMLTQHLADCLASVPPLQRWLATRAPGAPAPRGLDVGSGGGLPAVVWAVMLPGLAVDAVDAVGKKAAFVRECAASLHLPNLHSHHARVEALAGRYDLVACRAFATLADFVALTRARLAPGGTWLALKGRRPDDEIAALPADVEVFHVEPLQVPGLDAERSLVWMRLHATGSASTASTASTV
jgi:16S rRNA (guanine527-N7)-methyltransferase